MKQVEHINVVHGQTTHGDVRRNINAAFDIINENFAEGQATSLGQINLSRLDTLTSLPFFTADGYTGKAIWDVTYTIQNREVSVGKLLIFSDTMAHVVSQVFFTHCVVNSQGGFNAEHNHNKLFVYSRQYLLSERRWSDWTQYINSGSGGSTDVSDLERIVNQLNTAATPNNYGYMTADYARVVEDVKDGLYSIDHFSDIVDSPQIEATFSDAAGDKVFDTVRLVFLKRVNPFPGIVPASYKYYDRDQTMALGGVQTNTIYINKNGAGYISYKNSDNYMDLCPISPQMLSQLKEDANHRTVTDEEKRKWNSGTGGGSTNGVTSVNNKTGDVTLDGRDITSSYRTYIRSIDEHFVRIASEIDNCVVKDGDKGLSTNDFTTDDKNNLNSAYTATLELAKSNLAATFQPYYYKLRLNLGSFGYSELEIPTHELKSDGKSFKQNPSLISAYDYELMMAAADEVDNKADRTELAIYATQTWVTTQLSSYATQTWVTNEIAKAQLGGGGDVDLSGYATKEELKNKVDKVADMGLSHNDFTDEEKVKLAQLSTTAIEYFDGFVSGVVVHQGGTSTMGTRKKMYNRDTDQFVVEITPLGIGASKSYYDADPSMVLGRPKEGMHYYCNDLFIGIKIDGVIKLQSLSDVIKSAPEKVLPLSVLPVLNPKSTLLMKNSVKVAAWSCISAIIQVDRIYNANEEIQGLGKVVSDGLVLFQRSHNRRGGGTGNGRSRRKYTEWMRSMKVEEKNVLDFATLKNHITTLNLKKMPLYLYDLLKKVEARQTINDSWSSLFDETIGGSIFWRLSCNTKKNKAVETLGVRKVALCRKLVYTANGKKRAIYGERIYGTLSLMRGNANTAYNNFYLRFTAER